MNSRNSKMKRSLTFLALATVTALCLGNFTVMLQVSGQQTNSLIKATAFSTPEEAADALIDAAGKSDVAAIKAILGPDSYDIIETGEPAADKERIKKFADLAQAKKSVDKDQKNLRRATLSVGDDDWPFPVPIVKQGNKWYFDAAAGRKEILLRRVGENELSAIQICHGYVEAQHEYALIKHGQSGVNQYAQRIISTPGQQDGLAWKNEDGTWGGPVGENVAKAIERGYSSRTEPYHGYFFKVLKGQGPAAPLGELDYVVKGVMIGGFALIAAPAQYRVTGVKTFMVSNDGVVYEKDLGPNTLELAKAIERFNPDRSWSPVREN